MHDLYALGATLAVILVGLLYNGRQIRELRTELREDSSAVKTELRDEISAVKTELRDEISAFKTEVRDELRTTHTELTSEIRDARKETRDARTEVLARIDALQRDITQLVHEQGFQSGRLAALERGRAS